MNIHNRLALFGFLLLGAGSFVAIAGNSLWWPLVILGCLGVVGALNAGRPESLFCWLTTARWPLTLVYGLYLLIGAGQEGVGRVTHIWTYQGLYATTLGTVFLILIGYPFFLSLVHEIHVAIRYAGISGWITWLGTVTFVFIISELANQIAPLYVVNPPFDRYALLVFGIGYLIQALLAVTVRRAFQPVPVHGG